MCVECDRQQPPISDEVRAAAAEARRQGLDGLADTILRGAGLDPDAA